MASSDKVDSLRKLKLLGCLSASPPVRQQTSNSKISSLGHANLQICFTHTHTHANTPLSPRIWLRIRLSPFFLRLGLAPLDVRVDRRTREVTQVDECRQVVFLGEHLVRLIVRRVDSWLHVRPDNVATVLTSA
jgi:hypothetical protein